MKNAKLPKRRQFRGDLQGDDDLARRTARSTFVTRAFIVIGLAVLGAILYVLTGLAADTNTVVTKVSDKQNSNAPLLASIQSLAKQINSCTNPEGACAKRGQQNQKAAIGSIKADTRDIVVATIVCQQQGATGFDAVATCVNRSLAVHARARTGTR